MRSVLCIIVGPLSLWSFISWVLYLLGPLSLGFFISLVLYLIGPLSLGSFISLVIALFFIQSEASNYHFGIFEHFLIAAKVSSYICPLHLLYFACLSSELVVEYITA